MEDQDTGSSHQILLMVQAKELTSKTEIKSQTYQHSETINSYLKTSAIHSQLELAVYI